MHQNHDKSLDKVRVFEGLTEAELALIQKHCRRITFKASETIIAEGNHVPGFNILREGHLRVILPKKVEGRVELRSTDVNLNFMQEGECFSEYALIDQKPASATITAIEAGSYLQIPSEDFNHILQENERVASIIYRNLLTILIERLRNKEKEYDLMVVVAP